VHDIRAVRGVEERQHAKTQVDEAEPDREREEPEHDRERAKSAQIEPDAEHVARRDDGEEREDRARIDQVGP
jgi:hypothetical protein